MPRTDEERHEEDFEKLGLTAPRLTPDDIDDAIVDEDYHVFPGTTVTVCLLKLRNGFSVLGKSAAVSSENFNEKKGREIAREDARREIWGLEGYRLRQELFEGRQTSKG